MMLSAAAKASATPMAPAVGSIGAAGE